MVSIFGVGATAVLTFTILCGGLDDRPPPAGAGLRATHDIVRRTLCIPIDGRDILSFSRKPELQGIRNHTWQYYLADLESDEALRDKIAQDLNDYEYHMEPYYNAYPGLGGQGRDCICWALDYTSFEVHPPAIAGAPVYIRWDIDGCPAKRAYISNKRYIRNGEDS
jgi:hypothetical protein